MRKQKKHARLLLRRRRRRMCTLSVVLGELYKITLIKVNKKVVVHF